ncbi:MAG: hypothetical protein K2N14_03715 [Clostridia bacterium]|nr:hypothetical protein [Clostridia bacterium]
MAYVKVTKRLIKAICALVASVVLAIGVCLAWYVQNQKVEGNGLNAHLNDVNIKSFTVKAYSLKDKRETTGVTTYKVVAPVTEDEDGGIKMEAYGNLWGRETALLLEFKYQFNQVLNKNYAIYAELEKNIGEVIENEVTGTEFDFLCDLSMATGFYGAAVDGGVAEDGAAVTRKAALTADDEDEKYINLNGGSATESDDVLTFYCIIDYVSDNMDSLYLRVCELGGTIWSKMLFKDDINFYMQEV